MNLYKKYIQDLGNVSKFNINYSDTWENTLSLRKKFFTKDDFNLMRSPGNSVCSRFIDTSFLLDKNFFTNQNKFFNKIIKYPEPNFGQPIKDIKLNNLFFSSLFLKEAYYASIIIENIESRNIKNPKILEIGAGFGLLIYILKKYYKERITLSLVDVPEILTIQKYYLNNLFKLDKHKIIFKNNSKLSNFNYLVSSNYKFFKTKFDVVLNFDSMNLIDKSEVTDYLKYIENNLSDDGFFVFSNRHGVANKSFKQVYDYPFDKKWKINAFLYDRPYKTCTEAHHYFMLLTRKNKVKKFNIQYSLKILIILFRLNKINNFNSTNLLQIFNQNKKKINIYLKIKLKNKKLYYHLTKNKSLSYKDYVYLNEVNIDSNITSSQNYESIELIFDEIKNLVLKNLYKKNFTYNKQLKILTDKLLIILKKSKKSNCYFISRLFIILFLFKRKKTISKITNKLFKEKISLKWKLRIIKLLEIFNYNNIKKKYLNSVIIDDKDIYNYLFYISLLNKKEVKEKYFYLKKICLNNKANPGVQFLLLKIFLKNEIFDLIPLSIKNLNASIFDLQGDPLIQIINIVSENYGSKQKRLEIYNLFLKHLIKKNNYSEIKKIFLLIFVKKKFFNILISNSLQGILKNSKDYFFLSWCGKYLYEINEKIFAKKFLMRSQELRKNSLHYEFLGKIFFKNGNFIKSNIFFGLCLDFFPYKQYIFFYKLLSKLSKNRETIGYNTDILEILFYDGHDFYSDSLNWR